MRQSPHVRCTLSAAAALALLTACAESSNNDANVLGGSSSLDSSSNGEAAVFDEADAFCTDAQDAFAALESATTNADPSTIQALFADASSRLDSITAPNEISEPWNVLTDALNTAVTNVQGLDLTTREGEEAFVAEFSRLQTTATEAQAEVRSYVTAECSSPAGSAPSGVADAVAAAGISQDLVDRLATVASNTGYAISRGVPLNDEQAINFAFVQVQNCRSIQAGQTTAIELIAQDVADGAARTDAETMSIFLMQTFCPSVDN